jgi:hypothetical protein
LCNPITKIAAPETDETFGYYVKSELTAAIAERDTAIAERDAAIADLNILCDKVLELNTLLQKHENQND